jgi:hypothetical protein
MKISKDQAQKLAKEKYSKDIFVGTLNEVWDEARRRAKLANKPEPGRIDTERLDGVRWNDDLNEGSYVGVSDPITDSEGHYWFVLFPEYEYKFDFSKNWNELSQVDKWRFTAKCQEIESAAFTVIMMKYHTGLFPLVGNVSIIPEQEWNTKPIYETENEWVDVVVSRFLVVLRKMNIISD